MTHTEHRQIQQQVRCRHHRQNVFFVIVGDGRRVHSGVVDLGLLFGRWQCVSHRLLLEDALGQQETLTAWFHDDHRHPHHQPGYQRHPSRGRRRAAEDALSLAH